VVYVHMILGGLYCLFIAKGVPQSVGQAMGPFVEFLWLWLFVGMAICLLGKYLSSAPYKTRFWVFRLGLWLQLAGDVSAAGGFVGYVLGTLQMAWWGKAVVGVFGFAAYAWCATFLLLRDIRRITQARKALRHAESVDQ
ncbi:hypothetical protein A5733_17850, partial [Mycobacterium sp. NS-7484]|uniref:hypothetical protein n=1 Tax=Mycobacterium sp. NS-7484 TaxID=1834161 RepID=UPI00096EB8B4